MNGRRTRAPHLYSVFLPAVTALFLCTPSFRLIRPWVWVLRLMSPPSIHCFSHHLLIPAHDMSASPFRSASPDEKSPRTPHLGMGITRELPLPNTQRWSSSPASHALTLRPGSSSSSASVCGSTRRSPPTAELHSGMIPAPTVYRSPPILPRIQTTDPLASPVQAVQGVAVEVTGQHKRISGDFVLASPPKRHRRDVSHSSVSAYPTPARSNDSLAGSATRYWSPPKPTHVEPYRHPQQTHLTPLLARPRLSIHPYAAPQPHPVHPDARFYSACAMRPQLQSGLFGSGLSGPEGRGGSPASAISAGAGFKAPRKRGRSCPVLCTEIGADCSADDSQLAILLETFERTSYPSTEEREHLARKLGMTSRSVQIWVRLIPSHFVHV